MFGEVDKMRQQSEQIRSYLRATFDLNGCQKRLEEEKCKTKSYLQGCDRRIREPYTVFPSVQSVRLFPRTGRTPYYLPLPGTGAGLQSVLFVPGTDGRALQSFRVIRCDCNCKMKRKKKNAKHKRMWSPTHNSDELLLILLLTLTLTN